MSLNLGRVRRILLIQLVSMSLISVSFLSLHLLDCLSKVLILHDEHVTLLLMLISIFQDLLGDVPDFLLELFAHVFALLQHHFVVVHI